MLNNQLFKSKPIDIWLQIGNPDVCVPEKLNIIKLSG